MAFTDNNDRHSFPHRISTGYEINGVTVGPSEITFDYLDGSILSTNMEDGVKKTRRLRREIRIFTFKYPVLDTDEWGAIWEFYRDKAEHELYYFFINLYYFDPINYSNEWIGVNFAQKMSMRNFVPVLGEIGIKFIENVQATLTHTGPS